MKLPSRSTVEAPVVKKRIQKKEKHSLILLEATAWVVAEFGLSGTTIDRIQDRSGLSRGMINLHFGSKENLMLALLRHLNEKYRDFYSEALLNAEGSAYEKLGALIRSDFSVDIMNKIDSAVWLSFRAEARHNPEIHALAGTREGLFNKAVLQCCQGIAKDHPSDHDPAIVAEVLENLLEGLLLDYHMNQDDFDRAHAIRLCMDTVDAFFGIKPTSGPE